MATKAIWMLVVVVVVGAALPVGARAAGCAAPHSWVAGTTRLCHGTIVYGDYVDDDFGADTGAVDTGGRTAILAPAAGDARYPSGRDGTADLVRLTLTPRHGRLVVRALLNALYTPDTTELAVAIDTDDDRATGGGRWGTLPVRSDGWDEIAFFDRGDPATNTISGSMPLPPGRHWRVQALTADRASNMAMNVAFRGPGEHAGWTLRTLGAADTGTWFEDEQAAALRSGDVSRFAFAVDAAKLRRRATTMPVVAPGLHERVYESAYAVGAGGEGVNVTGVPGRGNGGPSTQSFQYLGRFQPYGVYVPAGPPPYGVQTVFHGSNSGIAGLINQPGMQRRFGEDLDRILVVPEARGSEGFGSDISERDVLDVLDDVERSYPVDRDRVFAGGYSQGGYVAFRLASLFPDRFAGVVTWVGFTGDYLNGTPLHGSTLTGGAVGNVVDLAGNLRSVPTTMTYAGADELVPVTGALGMADALTTAGSPFRMYLHPLAEHLTFAALDDWGKEAQDTRPLTLVHDPPRVTYRTAAILDDPAHGIVHDHAYWIAAIRPRTGGRAYADVDLTTRACGTTMPPTTAWSGGGTAPLPWVGRGLDRGPTGTALPDVVIDGTLRNVASARIDARRTCVAHRALRYDLTTDGPVVLTLSDGRTLRLDATGAHSGTLPERTKH